MITVKDLKKDAEVSAIIKASEQQIEALGYTEHSTRHLSIVSKWAGELMKNIGGTDEEVNHAEIAGFLHDIGNAINRFDHAQTGAIFSYNILRRLGMDYKNAMDIMMAIGNHDEKYGTPISKVSSVLILADKADVHKSRVRRAVLKLPDKEQNIHDRVNLAAESSRVYVDNAKKEITLMIEINTEVCAVMDYFEIYFGRMQMCRRAAEFIGYHFGLKINQVQLL